MGKMGFNKIPTLREYFELVKDKDIVTNIEMKTGVLEYLGIEQKVIDLIREFQMEDKVVISSFNHFTILRMKELAPDLRYGLLSETWIVNAGKYVHDLGIPCYNPLFRNLTDDVVKEIKQYGIEILTYTINTPEDVLDMQKKGIEVIISNVPDMVKATLDAQNA